MKIYIKYNNKKISINTDIYQSIKSIIYYYLEQNNINNDVDNFFLDYNGKYIDSNFSLEKYKIKNNSILNLNKKVKGGNSFIQYAKKNPKQVIICILITLLPMIILPMGFVSTISSLITVIINKSMDSIGKYLICKLGKITLFSRIKLIIFIIKYVIFFLMIYVIITLPLLILCVTIKGNSIMDNPKNMCSPLSSGNLAGMILTTLYGMIYVLFRGGNFMFNFIISLFKKVYILNTLFVPLLKSLLGIYNRFKYIPPIMMTFGILGAYLEFLSMLFIGSEMVLTTISDLGCKTTFTKEAFLSKLSKNVKNYTNDAENDATDHTSDNATDHTSDNAINDATENIEKKKALFSSDNILCRDEVIKCCDPVNYVSIADILSDALNTGNISKSLRAKGLYSSFVLIIEAFYESALSRINSSINLSNYGFNDKKIYLRKLLEEKRDVLSNNTKTLIKTFLESGNDELINDIEKTLGTEYELDEKDKINKINDIKYKLELLEENMINYSKSDKSKYIPGKSLFKTLFKYIFLNIFCNVVSTANSSHDVIAEMGDINEVIDMTKSSSATGVMIAGIYFITYIVLIICGIFNVY